MPYSIILYFQMSFNVKFASHLVRTRTTMEISSTPIAFCVILGIVIMCVKSPKFKWKTTL